MGDVSFLLLSISSLGTHSHSNVSCQAKFPLLEYFTPGSGLLNFRLSLLIVTILGLTTAVGSSATRARRGSSHPVKHSPMRRGRDVTAESFTSNKCVTFCVIIGNIRPLTPEIHYIWLFPFIETLRELLLPFSVLFCDVSLLAANISDIYIQWESRKVRTSPWAACAPNSLAETNPFLSLCRSTRTIFSCFTYSSR